ncbi:DUF2325 domain-containing protein [Candidatus Desulfovibrio trichonymphae]|uniref:DUF2325 domain-containing protein n=1 Tax=Candidatus Desulfovibrio trichonymphae TaxID=1725232 RepID=A0A1J1E4A2_9BACT|nr:DUF2325 domain-containing protein [Candidatus Desulfovibrio trichonymphae]BAV92288.1 conserved hypothetical protein [Candidatus Desulfovibrio trichonymphae]GHU98253.1 hypothetical protein AGMMS50248_04540 [Deltaproteobacteria bacterium]
MSFTLIGGMDRLRQKYIAAAKQDGHTLKCFSRNEHNLTDKIGYPDALIVFTNKVSHEAKRKAVQLANARNIPVRLVHSCGVSSLKACLNLSQSLKNEMMP